MDSDRDFARELLHKFPSTYYVNLVQRLLLLVEDEQPVLEVLWVICQISD
jgi:hypothetical protein